MDTNETKRRFYFWGDNTDIQYFSYLSDAFEARRRYAADDIQGEGIRLGLIYHHPDLGATLIDIENTFEDCDYRKVTDKDVNKLKWFDAMVQKKCEVGSSEELGDWVYHLVVTDIGKAAWDRQVQIFGMMLD